MAATGADLKDRGRRYGGRRRTLAATKTENGSEGRKRRGKMNDRIGKAVKTKRAASTILVASFLVVNGAVLTHGAALSPRSATFENRATVPAQVLQLEFDGRSSRLSGDDEDQRWQQASVAEDNRGQKEREWEWERQRPFADVDDRTAIYHEPSQTTSSAPMERAMATPDSGPFLRQRTPTPVQNLHERATLSKRASQVYTSGKALAVPSSYVSSIASSWNPGSRSIWFQRKAVIITSIFLAILIVLFIGAAVFLRDRREDDELLEEELDVSDEAALQRMRDERMMRTANKGDEGGSKEKSKKKRRGRRSRQGRDQDGQTEKATVEGGADDAAVARSSALNAKVASRWARIPLRRKKKSLSSQTRSNESLGPEIGLGRPRRSTETVEVHDANEQSQSLASPHRPNDESSASSNQHDAPSLSTGARVADNAELAATLEEAERTAAQTRGVQSAPTQGMDGEAFPPAYIPRSGAGEAPPPQHPHTANRPLAGSANDVLSPIPISDEKQRLSAGDGENRAGREDDDVYTQPSATASISSSHPLVQSSTSATSVGDRDRYAAHLATDDKELLRQMQSAASMPSASAPIYSSSTHNLAASSPSEGRDHSTRSHSSTGPSAPSMLDQDGFERLDEEAADQDPATLQPPPRDADLDGEPIRDVKGKGVAHSNLIEQGHSSASSASMLPAPPTLREPTFSRFDMPYAPEWERPSIPSAPKASEGQTPISASRQPSAPAASAPSPSAARTVEEEERTEEEQGKPSEKSREAQEEQRRATLALLGSRPGQSALVEGFGGDEDAEHFQGPADHLPRYEPKRREATETAPSAPPLLQPSAPSAPVPDDEDEIGEEDA